MKVGIITKPNEKGQIVIPKKFRQELGISKDALLNLVIRGKGIYLYPVYEVIPKIESENSYLQILKKTKGKWTENSQRKFGYFAYDSSRTLRRQKHKK